MLTLAADAGGRSEGRVDPVRRIFSCASDAAEAVAEIGRQLDGADPAFILLFAAPSHDLEALAAAAGRAFGEVPVIGATSAGEISPRGYEEGAIVGAAFERTHFSIATDCIEDLSSYSIDRGREVGRRLVRRLEESCDCRCDASTSFGVLIADGMSRREESLVAGVASGLGSVPLLGGSAGDGLDFRRPYVLHRGRFRRNAALVAVIRSACPFHLFKFDHFEPTGLKMVVTGADVEQRLITEINAEPAAEEYARLLGLEMSELSPFVFAAHPLAVRVGGVYHVRSIQGVEPGGGLRTFCAIDEGLVLTVVKARHMSTELAANLDALRREFGPPAAMLAFDCVLRRLEAERTQQLLALSRTMSEHNAVGFCSYGEQFRAMHVNQTIVGVYFSDPGAATLSSSHCDWAGAAL